MIFSKLAGPKLLVSEHSPLIIFPINDFDFLESVGCNSLEIYVHLYKQSARIVI